MKYIKNAVLVFAFISLIMTILSFQETYAKYKTDVSGTTNISIARWRILLNNQDIRNNSEITSVITPTFINNPNILNNVIAPTAEGYFDLVIDCSEADVSFNYSITTSPNSESIVTDLVVTGYSLNNGPVTTIADNTTISNDVLKENNVNLITIRIYLKWDDSEGANMDNTQDTAATVGDNAQAKLNVSLNFTQLA